MANEQWAGRILTVRRLISVISLTALVAGALGVVQAKTNGGSESDQVKVLSSLLKGPSPESSNEAKPNDTEQVKALSSLLAPGGSESSTVNVDGEVALSASGLRDDVEQWNQVEAVRAAEAQRLAAIEARRQEEARQEAQRLQAQAASNRGGGFLDTLLTVATAGLATYSASKGIDNPALTALATGGLNSNNSSSGGAASAPISPAQAPSATMSDTAMGNCNKSLGYLDSRLPRYDTIPEIRSARQSILQEDMVAAYRRARAAGLSAPQVAQMSLQQARENDAAAAQAAQCFNTVTVGSTIRAQVDNGTYIFGNGGIQDSCAGSYIVTKMGAIAMRETAINMICLTRTMN